MLTSLVQARFVFEQLVMLFCEKKVTASNLPESTDQITIRDGYHTVCEKVKNNVFVNVVFEVTFTQISARHL